MIKALTIAMSVIGVLLLVVQLMGPSAPTNTSLPSSSTNILAPAATPTLPRPLFRIDIKGKRPTPTPFSSEPTPFPTATSIPVSTPPQSADSAPQAPGSSVDVLAPSAAESIPRSEPSPAVTSEPTPSPKPQPMPTPLSEAAPTRQPVPTPSAAPKPAATLTPIPTATPPVPTPTATPAPTSFQNGGGTFTTISFESTLGKQADGNAIVEGTFSAELTGSFRGITKANLRCTVKATGPGSCNGTGSFTGTACVDSHCRAGTLLLQDLIVKIDGASVEGRLTILRGTGGLENLDGVVTFQGTFPGPGGTGTYTAQVSLNGFR